MISRGLKRIAGFSFQLRNIDLYESHAKELFTQYGISHQRGYPATSVEDALEKAKRVQAEFDVENVIVKAQVLAGGRGKGSFDTGYKGGVQFCTSLEKVEEAASEMLGNYIHTAQTKPEGILVEELFIAECLDFDNEIYFALLLDRDSGGPVFVASTEGGVEIEQVAKESPELIFKLPVDARVGPSREDLLQLGEDLTLGEDVEEFAILAERMYEMVMDNDLLMVEVNPLVHGEDGIKCLDAKFGMDDNSLFRQTEALEKFDFREMDYKEIEAKKFGLEYIALDGNIGCLVNGAGLAMSTMDIIKLHGGEPANFLDVGGGADADQVREAFTLITEDENVKGILVNIFGGIMRCDIIADGIIQACKAIDLEVPLVVRLSGTNSEEGKRMLDESKLPIISAVDLEEAAKLAVKEALK